MREYVRKCIGFVLIAMISQYGFCVKLVEGWKDEQMTKTYMRAISKDLCTKKTIVTLNKICKSNECIADLAGVLGDCVNWAKGDRENYCKTYQSNYIKPYCDSKFLDSRRCLLLHIHFKLYCRKGQTDSKK